MASIFALADSHVGEVAYIIGKGPSLDNVDRSWFKEEGPKLCLNESILRFEALGLDNVYSIQQDGKPQCMVEPDGTPLILSQQSDTWFPNYEPRYTYNQVRDLNIMDKQISAVSAVEIARIMGCTSVVFIAFDACTVGVAGYPRWIKYADPANSIRRFQRFFNIIRLNLRGFTGTFLDPDGSVHAVYQSAPYTVITLTGDRHVPFKFCKEWILRQTILPGQWIVIDDGHRQMRWNQYAGADYYRRRPNRRDPKHTIKLNMLEALKHIRYDSVIIMEDDDWYHPTYCEKMLKLLTSFDLVGQVGAYLYYWPLTQIVHTASVEHAGLFKTGFTRFLYPVVEEICKTIKGPLIDMALWQQPLGERKLIPEKPPLAIGMKGLLGRQGHTSGWNTERRGYRHDPDNEKLKSFIGEDVKTYEKHFARIQRRPMDYATKEDNLYSWLWEKGPYADGRGAAPRIAKFVSWAKQVADLKNLSIIDLGCGKAELANLLPYRKYLGVDISTYQVEQNILNLADERTTFLRHTIDELPLEDMSHDLAICQDVMEHIPENRVDRVLREMFRVASAVMVIIDCKAARLKGPKGQQLHCTVKDPSWWREKIEKLSVIRYEDYQDYKLTLYCGSGYKSQGVFPDVLHGVRLRRHPDGSVWISKRNPQVEKHMDEHFSRTGRELRWHYKIEEPVSIKRLKDRYVGKSCYIIGKGPSLDYIDANVLDSGVPIICLNQSVHHMETLDIPSDDLYVMQQDTGINCRPVRATPLLHFYIKHLYPEITSRYIFTDTDFGRPRHSLTVLVAIAAARYMGCSELRLVAFDACVNQKIGYAKCIGHQPIKTHSGGAIRFLTHKKRIIEEAGEMPIVWICPQPQAV